MSNQPLVIYHSGCRDGFCAAWCIWRKHAAAEFFPGVFGVPPPDVAGRDGIIVDFSYPRESMVAIANAAKSLLVLDHHATAEAALTDFPVSSAE